MEFNLFDHFKGLGKAPLDSNNPYEQGATFFSAGQLGERIAPHLDQYADKARVSRRTLMKSVCGFAGAMLAVNHVTGMRFFEVDEAEAYDGNAALEKVVLKKENTNFVVDMHTHICWRKDGYVMGKNTTEKGMWFVKLLDDLGKAMGLPQGVQDMTVDNFGKMLLVPATLQWRCSTRLVFARITAARTWCRLRSKPKSGSAGRSGRLCWAAV